MLINLNSTRSMLNLTLQMISIIICNEGVGIFNIKRHKND